MFGDNSSLLPNITYEYEDSYGNETWEREGISADAFAAVTITALTCLFFSVSACCYFALKAADETMFPRSCNQVITAAQTQSPAYLEAQPISVPVLYIER